MDQLGSQTGQATGSSGQAGPLSMLNPTIDPNTATVVDSTSNPASTNLEAMFVQPTQATSSPVTAANNSNPSTAALNTVATNGLNL